VNPLDHSDKPIQQVLVEMTDGGLDYTFEAVGSVLTMVSMSLCHLTTVISSSNFRTYHIRTNIFTHCSGRYCC